VADQDIQLLSSAYPFFGFDFSARRPRSIYLTRSIWCYLSRSPREN